MGYQDDYKPRPLAWLDDAADWIQVQTWNRVYELVTGKPYRHKDWHSWIHHGLLTLIVGGGLGTLVGWAAYHVLGLPAWTVRLGTVVGTGCGVPFYIWREGLTVRALGVFRQDNVGDVLGPLTAFLGTALALFPLQAASALLGLLVLFYALLILVRLTMVRRDETFGVLVLKLPHWWRPSGRSSGIRWPGFREVWAIIAPDDQEPREHYQVTVRHEGWGHGPQWVRYGFFGFLWRYSDPYGRRRLEVRAFAESLAERVWHGNNMSPWVRHYARALSTQYSMPQTEDFSMEGLGLMILAEYDHIQTRKKGAAA